MTADSPAAAPHALAQIRTFLRQHWVRCLLVLLLGIAVRFPALQGQLIWDDTSLVRDHPFTKSPYLAAESFRHYLAMDGSSTHYRPVQLISYSLDYFLWKNDTYGYHLTNVLLHVGSGILLYLLLVQLLSPLALRLRTGDSAASTDTAHRLLSGAAVLAALLWVVHPVHSAAVDYISGRADSLAFFFACGAWLLYLRAGKLRNLPGRSALYTFAGASLLLALCSRESACLWVLLFLLHLFLVDRTTAARAKWLALTACIALVALYGGLRQLPAQTVLASASAGTEGSSRPVLMLRALGDYGRLMVWPSNLHVERTVETPLAFADATEWRQRLTNESLTILGAFVAAVLLYGSLRKGKARPLRIAGAVWFLVAFLPISNLLHLNATVAEHWLYLPSVGLLLFLVGCCLELPAPARRAVVAVACLATVALSARSFVRSGDWLSPETFYRHALASGAAKTRMALNLGQIYAAEGNYAKAEPLLRKVVQMNPDYPMAQNALGHLLLSQGKTEEAEQVFAVATKLAERTRAGQPRTWIAALNVAYIRYREKDLNGALETVQKANAEYPGTWPLINLEAELLSETQGAAAAIPLVEAFARDRWWHLPASLSLAKLYLQNGDEARAEQLLQTASRLDVHNAEPLNLMALIRIQRDQLDDAYRIQRRAVSRQPDQPRQYVLLSDVLQRMGRMDEARLALAQVTRLEALARGSNTAR